MTCGLRNRCRMTSLEGFRLCASFTPTRVGNIHHGDYAIVDPAVHPHTRGEHHLVLSSMILLIGSPPHAWGTWAAAGLQPGLPRFTPTRVGNILPERIEADCWSVHPHTRGEHVAESIGIAKISGSPPHAWGTCPHGFTNRQSPRFTPTRVGNIRCNSSASSWSSVHPHTRGEHGPQLGCNRGCHGSPPHAWGTFCPSGLRLIAGRFTPTRVGNMSARVHQSPKPTVHPHTRGEHSLQQFRVFMVIGSPPHAWGTYGILAELMDPLRFTPTRVGNISHAQAFARAWTVHPHTRGEHRPPVWSMICHAGSPPHAWGTSSKRRESVGGLRFTPTRVGNIFPFLI